VATVTEWPEPRSVQDIKQFLGFCGFYRRFIKGYSKITAPLCELEKRKQSEEDERDSRSKKAGMTAKQRSLEARRWRELPIDIGEKGRAAFTHLKDAFAIGKVLRYFRPELPLRVESDASDYAISATLSQRFEDGWHPIAFFSRKMTGAELNYFTPDQELLALHEAFVKWRHFLKFPVCTTEVYTDHLNILHMMKKPKLSERQASHCIFLSTFDIEISHIAGAKNPADGSSRRPDYNNPVERDMARQAGLPLFVSKFRDGPQNQGEFIKLAEACEDDLVRAVAAWALAGESLEEAVLKAQKLDRFVT